MLAVITGSGALPLATQGEPVVVPALRYGPPSGVPLRVEVDGTPVLLLARHGVPHRVAPHRVNYRANVEALARLGATRVIALNTVGGIAPEAWTGRLVVPHQLIDYTWGRAHTFVEDGDDAVLHVDFGEPLDAALRQALVDAGVALGIDVGTGGVYGCTQGPRFETAAEIERMARDGCTLVGMTGMPEAGLARERGLPYAMLSLVVNPAAGRGHDPFNLAAIGQVISGGMAQVEQLLREFIRRAR
jgi:5'-methylthioinosine phosphorylase